MTQEVAEITGEAEAILAKIYAEAHSKDPDLYRFIRSLDTLEEYRDQIDLILRTDAALDVLVEE